MSDLTLHWWIVSQPSRSIKVLLEYSKLKYNDHIVVLPKGQHKSEDYLKIHKRGLVPAIQDGDFALGESTAIARYLCDSQTGIPPTLWPQDPIQKA